MPDDRHLYPLSHDMPDAGLLLVFITPALKKPTLANYGILMYIIIALKICIISKE